MAKIYIKKYSKAIENGEMTKAQALADIDENVPQKWHDEVYQYINEHF